MPRRTPSKGRRGGGALERQLDRLYGLPLGEFTPARNELAKRLRNDGEKQDAEQVAALRKPTIAAWGINQLARREKGRLADLTRAAEQLRKTQEEALRGHSPERVRESSRAFDAAIATLVEAAGPILAGEGRPATDAVRQRIGSSLRATAGDEDALELVTAGRLSEDLDPSGFGSLLSLELPQRAKPPKQVDRAREKREREETERRRLDAEARELRRGLEQAAREAREADRQAEAKEREQRELARQLERLEKRLRG